MPPDRRVAVVDAVHACLLGQDGAGTADLGRVRAEVRQDHPLLPAAEVTEVAAAVAARAVGLGPLEPLLAEPGVTEVMVNGRGDVWIERAGALVRTALVLTAGEVELLVERIVGPLGLRADRTSPVADARLPDGSRVNVVVPPLAVDGPCITIRRFGAQAIPLGALCPPGVAELLAWAVAARANVIVSGGTGAGKTTVLNALGALLPDGDRIVTVEDTAELRLPGSHVVRLEARPATADGIGATTIRELVRNALRMRPDRIVVGEVRGAEAIDMVWAMNTGHEGSLSTCHANSPIDALRRLEVMVLSAGLDLPLAAVRDQLTSAIDLVVQVTRLADGAAGITAVGEVVDRPGDGQRIRLLAGADGVHDLPRRIPLGQRPAARSGLVPVTGAALAVGLLAVGATVVGLGAPSGPTARAPEMEVSADPWRAIAGRAERGRAWLLRRRTAARIDALLPDLLERIASGVRAGLALGPAVASAAEGSPPPLGPALDPLAHALRHGAALGPELARWAGAPEASDDVRLVAAALELSRQAGGPASRVVDRVAVTLRERRELQAEARALATQARASAGVLAVAPLVFTALVATIEPAAAAVLVTTPVGAACLVGGLVLEGLGAVWMARIVRSAW